MSLLIGPDFQRWGHWRCSPLCHCFLATVTTLGPPYFKWWYPVLNPSPKVTGPRYHWYKHSKPWAGTTFSFKLLYLKYLSQWQILGNTFLPLWSGVCNFALIYSIPMGSWNAREQNCSYSGFTRQRFDPCIQGLSSDVQPLVRWQDARRSLKPCTQRLALKQPGSREHDIDCILLWFTSAGIREEAMCGLCSHWCDSFRQPSPAYRRPK